MSEREILVVDPDESTRALLTEFFHEEGFPVTAIASVDQALGRAPAIVLLTVVRHELSTLAIIRTRLPSAPVVVLTGLSAHDLPDEALTSAGAAAVVRKPFGLEELASTIGRHYAPGGTNVSTFRGAGETRGRTEP